MPSPTRISLTVGLLLAFPHFTDAKPQHKQALVSHFGPFLAKKLDDCRTCHLTGQSEQADETEKPHNAFGARLAEMRDLLKLDGKPYDIPARLEAIAEEDADGDGVSNFVELVSGHSPGDAADKPTAEELAQVKQRLAAFREYQKGHPWRPFEPVQRPAVPTVRAREWVRNPIDAFVAAGHERHHLTPRPEAPREILLRRVYLDLTGLPPTRDELHAFLADTSTDAYDKIVDKLLASPRYGERWGRHWMDVWRYSDWAGWGAQVRDSQPHIWHWRDWIIESLNKDKGYDRMIVEMLAADEIAPNDPDALRATGYLVRSYKLLSRERWLQETVEHTFLAFQAVTINCARCHDHMFDPIEQKEYYRVRAIFEPYQVRIDRIPGEPDTKKDGLPRVYDAELQAPTYVFVRGDDRTPDKSTVVAAGVPAALGTMPAPSAVKLPLTAASPDKRDFVIRETIAASERTVADMRTKAIAAARTEAIAVGSSLNSMPQLGQLWKLDIARRLAELDLDAATVAHEALVAVLKAEQLEDNGKTGTPEWTAAATAAQGLQRRHALANARRDLFAAQYAPSSPNKKQKTSPEQQRAEAQKSLAKAEADLKQPAGPAYTKRALTSYPSTTTGRRLALAQWFANGMNPLTARVAVNHIWLRHFDQAIVPSVFDFGHNGRMPSDPALLDWLAAEFMDHGWSMKHLHRLIVTSNTYRQSSTPESSNLAKDPDNVFLWRMVPHRLEAEVVRDLAFCVSGQLDAKMGGPDIDHSLGLTTPRRSLYFQHAAEKQMEFLKLFDVASVNECYQRRESVLPQQALALFNSGLVIQHARILARKLGSEARDDDREFVRGAFETVLARLATDAEMSECVSFLTSQMALHSKSPKAGRSEDADGKQPSPDPRVRARENLVQVLMNHHDFVTVR